MAVTIRVIGRTPKAGPRKYLPSPSNPLFSQWAMDGPLTAPILRQAQGRVNRLTRLVRRSFRPPYRGPKAKAAELPEHPGGRQSGL